MRIIRASASNFASYKEMDVDFTERALTLISGPTGSGKSTLCDLVPWILFGRTAKGGAVDEIVPWNTDGITTGTLTTDTITVSRTRNPNDLHFIKDDAVIRGKDSTDTQRLINEVLGCDYDTYLAGAYLHEFSHTAGFFTATAKIRRQIIEELVDLSLAVSLTEGVSASRKTLKKDIDDLTIELATKRRIQESLSHQIKHNTHWTGVWEQKKASDLEKLQEDYVSFESNKAKDAEDCEVALIKQSVSIEHDIDDLELELADTEVELGATPDVSAELAAIKDTRCDHCGNRLESTLALELTKKQNKRERLLQHLVLVKSRIKSKIESLVAAKKRLREQLQVINNRINTADKDREKLKASINPYSDQLHSLMNEFAMLVGAIDLSQFQLEELKVELSDADLLLSLIDELRKTCVKTTIVDIQTRTNVYLAQHFDAEIKVKFDLEGSDKIEVEIFKDGNTCVYTQLSKGQRQMLKLSFGVAVMELINLKTTGFNTLMFDESLDGMSEEIKAKAYRLFEQLSTKFENVFVVDHSESFKSLFTNKIEVELVDGNSQIAEIK